MSIIKQRFELDYWGLSYREGLEYIVSTDPQEKIKIAAATSPADWNAFLLPERERRRLFYCHEDNAKYYLTTYRYDKDEYNDYNPYYSIEVGGAKILGVYKLRDDVGHNTRECAQVIELFL
jgi:hypothetical protein